MKKNNIHKDEALRAALTHKERTITEPMLSDDFVERLMQRIEAAEKPSRRQSSDWWLNAVSIISAIAAVLVVVSFIRLQMPSFVEKEHAYTYYNIGNPPKSCTLENVYTRRSEQKKSNQLTYTHFRRMIYEHN